MFGHGERKSRRNDRSWLEKIPAEMIAEMIAGRLPQNFPAEMIARKNDRELFWKLSSRK